MADQLVSVLGFDATDAIKTLTSLNDSLAGYTQAMRKAASATRAYNKAAQGVDANLRKQANVIKGFAAGTTNLASAQKTVTTQAAKTSKTVKDLGKDTEDAAQKTKRSSQIMVLSWQSVIRVFVLQGIHSAISAMTQALTDGAAAAREYEISLGEIQTISRDLNLTIDEISERVRKVSEDFGIPLETVAEGTYQTLSNQVADAAQTFEFLEDASALAVGAVTDLDSSVNLLSSVINSYNLNARDADEVSGKLFKTIELGRIRGEEFANTYGRVLVLASQLGISFDEVNAAMATFTVSGLRANEAMTLSTNIMLKLIRPTDALKARMDELGVTTAEAGIQAFGFQGFLQEITKESGNSASAVGELFGRIRAVRGVLGITSKQAETYAKNLELISKAGEADIFRARKLILELDAKQLERDIQAVKNFFIVDLGRAINSTILNLSKFAGGGVTAVKAVGAAVLTSTALFLGLKLAGTSAFAALTLGASSFAGAAYVAQLALGALLSPLGLVIAAGAAIGVAVVASNKLIKKSSDDTFRAIDRQSKLSLERQLDNIEKRQNAEEKVNSAILADTQKFLFDRQKLFLKDQEVASRQESLVLRSIKDQVQDRLSAFESFVDGLRDKSSEAVKAIKSARDEINSIGQDITAFKFERSLTGLDQGQVVARQVKEANRLRIEAQRAIESRDFERAKSLQDQALSLNNQALRSADQLKDRTAIAKIERSIVSTYQEQQNLQKSIIADQKAQEAAAESQRAASEASLNRLKQAVSELDDLEIASVGDPEKAKKAFAEVTARIEQEFSALGSRVSVADYLGLKEYIRKAMEPLRDPTTGQKARLDLIIDPNIDSIYSILETSWRGIPERAKLQITDITGASFSAKEGFAPLIEGVVESVKAQKDLNAAELKRVQTENALVTNTRKLQEIQKIVIDDFGRRVFLEKSFGALIGQRAQSEKEQIAFTKAFAATQKALAEGNVEEINKQIRALEIYVALLERQTEGTIGGIQGVAAGVPELIHNLNLLIEGYKQTRDIKNELLIAPTNTGQRNEQIRTLGNVVTQTNQTAIQTEAAVQQANTTTAITINNKTRAVQDYIRSVQKANQLSLSPNTVERKGITITRRAQGGVGTDTVPAMLTPGEFVVNAKSTRKFFPQLVAMNAGRKPIFRQTGGTVTNVGDVSINVHGSAEPKQTARETMKAFRRVTRRDS